jgi:hypothetical protein
MQDSTRCSLVTLASTFLCAGLLACGQQQEPSGGTGQMPDPSQTGANDASTSHAASDAGPPPAPAYDASGVSGPNTGSRSDAGREAGADRDTDAGGSLDAALRADAAYPLDAAAPMTDAASTDARPPADAGNFADAGRSPDATADAALPPDLGVEIALVAVTGTLCAKDSWNASISGDKHAVTVTFSAAELQARNAAGLEGSCRLTFDLRVPAGYQFSQAVIAPSGYTFSERGAADLLLSYAFPAFSATGAQQTFSHRDIPSDTDFVFRDRVDSVWSPTCDASSAGKPLRLALELSLRATVDAYISISSLDFDFALQTGQIAFRACP